MAGKIYVAKTSGIVRYGDGQEAHIQQGVTRVREGHPLLKGREKLFEELSVQYDVETARQAPRAEAKPEPKVEKQTPEPEAKAEDKPAGLTSEDAPTAPARKSTAPRQSRGPRKSS